MSKLKTQSYNSNVKSKDLKVRSYRFSLDTIKFIEEMPNKRIYWVISDQLMRAATSIGANITEAKASSSKREFIKFYGIALKSANESRYWLSLLRDAELQNIDLTEVEVLLQEVEEIANMLGAALLTLKGRRNI